MESKENMSFYPKGKVFSAKGRGTHITNEYQLIGDEVSVDGNRIIKLKLIDQTEHLQHCSDLANKLVVQLGEPVSSLLRTVIYDSLRDFLETDILDMLKQIGKGEQVKKREGCFKLIIGDGRKKRHHEIMLSE